jgi:hypothetical protein
MNRTRLSAVDILGITLGVVVLSVVMASIALIVRGFGTSFQWSRPGVRGFWSERPSQHDSFQLKGMREEKDDVVPGSFTTIEIRNIAGEIDIHAGTGDSVAIHSTKTAMFPAAIENLTMRIEKRGDRLLVEERHDAGFIMSAGTVSFDIGLPIGVRTIEAHSVSGNITVHDLPSSLDQTLSTISGSISTSRAGNLEASSTSGSLQFAFAGSHLDAHTVSGVIEGQIESLGQGGSVTLRSVSGSVVVDAYAGLDAFVSLNSVSGGVSCGFPLTRAQEKRNSLEGSIGSGSSHLEVTTTSGTIMIRKL